MPALYAATTLYGSDMILRLLSRFDPSLQCPQVLSEANTGLKGVTLRTAGRAVGELSDHGPSLSEITCYTS